ncbi:MAG: InlB B-repeat-containing protein, partial [Fibrobacter sp.]|nr:InlB B-repeat-containing protein [Fibrobacter sp.]
MKAKIGLFLFTMLAMAGMGFAAPGFPVTETPKSYYNLTTVYTQQGFNRITTLVLSQGATPCSSSEWSLSYKGANYVANGSGDIGSYSGGGFFGMGQQFTTKGKCLAAFDDTPANLAEKLETLWVKNAELHKVALELGSDIDLKEFAANTKVGECSVNHVPLPMMDSTSFNGNGFTISHMCYAATVTKDSPMEAPVGFFKTASDVSMQNIKLNGVRIYITGESENGADYYPVGALVGAVNSMSIDTVLLANDSIQAPLAGGVVGYLENATVSNVTGDDDINISNTTTITTGYAGSKIISKVLYQELDHKVFLGGIAGVAIRSEHAEDATFLKDSIKVDVHNRAKGFRSALGGIAGYFKTVGGTQEKLQVYTKYKDQGEIVPTKISGGSSMGGIFGVVSVNRETSGMVTSSGNLTVSNSKFDGKITNASSPAVIAVGGIVGYDSTGNMSSLSLVQNYSKIDVKDDLKDAGNYQYYAGGIVGYGGSCLGGTGKDEEFLSVIGSKAEGAISLSASAATVNGLRSDAYLGGIAGSACLARTKGNGLTNDTSLVAITSKVKTAVDNQKLNNGANARDNVYVGGVVGSVAVAVSNKADTLSGLYYNGSIVVEDSLNNVYAGGILGGFPRSAGGKWIYLEKSIARSEGTLVSYSVKEAGVATTTNKQQVAIGGACGICDEFTGLNFVGVTGNINVSAKNTGDAMYVGGLIGYADVPNAADMKTVVQNTYSIGNILVNANNTANAQYVKNVGYLMGRAVLGGAYEIISSYHYGEDKDDLQIDAFGSLSNGVDITATWAENANIYYVIRNGAVQSLHGGAKHQNGTEIASTMKTAKFAGFLNEAYTENKEYAWAFAKDTNNDLPVFAINGYLPVLPDVEYVVTFVGMNNKHIKTVPVPEHGAAIPPTLAEMEEYQEEGYTFTGNWDSRGKDYEDVTDDITVYAVYSVNVYDVKFFNYDSTLQIGETQEVEYMMSAVAPDAPVREGYTFDRWSASYTQVKDNLNIKALYTANE